MSNRDSGVNMNIMVIFVICIAIAIAMIFRGYNIALSIAIATLLYTSTIFGLDSINVIVSAMDSSLINTLLALLSAMFLADLYSLTRASKELVESLTSISPRLSSIAIPMAIGLLPMPAGAYVSATIVDELYNRFGLNPIQKTFINYWYRHIWVPIWPLYQAVILSSAILDIPIRNIILNNIPIAIAHILSGTILFLYIYRNRNIVYSSKRIFSGLIHLWPFILIAIFSIALNISIALSIAITSILFIVVYRPSLRDIYRAVKYMFNPTIIGLIIFSFIFSRAIEKSNIAYSFASIFKGYEVLALFLTPFAIVLATGFEFTFAILAFPPLKILLNSQRNILLAFTGGFIGAMLSPSHACLAMSAEYYGAKIKDVYRYILPSSLMTVAIVFLYTYLLYP